MAKNYHRLKNLGAAASESNLLYYKAEEIVIKSMFRHLAEKLPLYFLGILFVFLSFSDSLAQNNQTVEETDLVNARSAYIDGLAAFENANYQQALKLLKAAYVKLPDRPGVNYALADAYFMVNDLTNAEYYGKQAVQLAPRNLWFRLKLVDIYTEAGKEKAVISELRAAGQYHPNDSEVLYKLAKAYSGSDQLQKANEIYNKLLFLRGEDIGIRLQKLRHFNSLNMKDSALAELRKIRDLDPGNLSTLHLLSNQYLQMNRRKKAKEVLGNARDINEESSKTVIMLTDIYIKEAKWDSAGTLLSTMASDSSIDKEEKLNMGRYLYSRFTNHPGNGELKQVTGQVLQQLMETEPQSSQIQALAADFFAKTNQHGLALKALEKATQLSPTNDSAWRQRLRLLLVNGKTEEAITVGKQAIEEIPQDPIILYFLGSAHLSRQNYQQAIDNLQKAEALPVRRNLKSSILSALADAHAATENWTSAFRHYEKSLNLNPRNALVLNNYAYYLSLQKQELSRAEEMAKKAISLAPGNSSYLDTLGWIYYQWGKYRKAEQYIRSSLETGKASAEVMEHMGDVLHKLNNPEEARKWWRKALQKDSTRSHLKDKISPQGE